MFTTSLALNSHYSCGDARIVRIQRILTILAETQRAPFDFAEGERELVRGFNIEFWSARFSLLFLAEISTILFFAGLTSCFFRNGYLLGVAVISCIFLIARTSYPRFRYDLLIYTF